MRFFFIFVMLIGRQPLFAGASIPSDGQVGYWPEEVNEGRQPLFAGASIPRRHPND